MILNSFLIIFFSYLLIHIITTSFSALVANWFFEIPSTLSRWGLKFLAPDSSKLWTHSSVIGIYSVPLIILLIIIIFSFKGFYPNRFKLRSPFKLFLIWTYIHAFNLFFGGLGIGVILKEGAGYVPRWMGVPEPLIFGFSILGFFLLAINGLVVNDFLSAYAEKEEQLIKVKDQVKFKINFVGIPVLIFVLGNILFGFPDWRLYNIVLNLTLLLPLPGIIFYHECLCEPNERIERWTKFFHPLLIVIGILMLTLSIISIV